MPLGKRRGCVPSVAPAGLGGKPSTVPRVTSAETFTASSITAPRSPRSMRPPAPIRWHAVGAGGKFRHFLLKPHAATSAILRRANMRLSEEELAVLIGKPGYGVVDAPRTPAPTPTDQPEALFLAQVRG